MHGFTDRDIAYDMLFGTKRSATSYCEAALESASPSCYRMFMELHDDAQQTHRRVWELLHQRQEYRVMEAHPQDISEVRNRMAQLASNQFEGAGRSIAQGASGFGPGTGAQWGNQGGRPHDSGSRGFSEFRNEAGYASEVPSRY